MLHARRGLREGDEIIKIDGKPASTFTLDQFYRLFKQEGREYLFEIARGEERLSVRVKLRRIV
jgi:C-terminal processing protease CtpA/Prc